MIARVKAFAAGFLLGVLVAPRAGRDSRRLLMERIAEFLDLGRREYEELEEELEELKRSNGTLGEGDWPEVDETMVGPDVRPGA